MRDPSLAPYTEQNTHVPAHDFFQSHKVSESDSQKKEIKISKESGREERRMREKNHETRTLSAITFYFH